LAAISAGNSSRPARRACNACSAAWVGVLPAQSPVIVGRSHLQQVVAEFLSSRITSAATASWVITRLRAATAPTLLPSTVASARRTASARGRTAGRRRRFRRSAPVEPAELGDDLQVRGELAQQPEQFDVAAAGMFEPARRADRVQVTIDVEPQQITRT
jgi:hypothetical protein